MAKFKIKCYAVDVLHISYDNEVTTKKGSSTSTENISIVYICLLRTVHILGVKNLRF